jgi:hypothetical protein
LAWVFDYALDDRQFVARSAGLSGQTEVLSLENLDGGYQATIGSILIYGAWAIIATSAVAGNRRAQLKLRKSTGPITILHFLGTNPVIGSQTARVELATGMTQAAAQSGVVREQLPTFLHLPIALLSFELQFSIDNVQAGDVLTEVGIRGQLIPRSPS